MHWKNTALTYSSDKDTETVLIGVRRKAVYMLISAAKVSL